MEFNKYLENNFPDSKTNFMKDIYPQMKVKYILFFEII